MPGWHVRYNHFGAIARAMPRRIDDCVNEAATDITNTLKTTLWVDTGMIRRVTTEKLEGLNHAEVWVGYNRGHGFYSRFQEWGTHKQAARPIVGPTAHAYEPIFTIKMTQAIKRAARAQ